MKKQSNLSAADRKLSLNKKTISNLLASEMNKKVGGASAEFCTASCHGWISCPGGRKTCNPRNC